MDTTEQLNNKHNWFARAARTKCQKLGAWAGAVNHKKFIFSQFWRLKSTIKVLARFIAPEANLCGLQVTTDLLCPHVAFPPCKCITGVSSSLVRAPVLSDQDPPEWPHSISATSLKTPSLHPVTSGPTRTASFYPNTL